MARSDKRKYHDYQSGSHHRHRGIGDALNQVKKARSANENSSRYEGDRSMDRQPLSSTTNAEGEDGWTTITSKSSRRRDHHRNHNKHAHHDDVPHLTFKNKLFGMSTIQLKDLRDLALYVLTDGVAPTWVAVKKAKEIETVVVLMLPGLDEGMLERAKQLFASSAHQSQDQERTQTCTEDDPNTKGEVKAESVLEQEINGASATQGDTTAVPAITDPDRPLTTADLKWLFDGVISVKAPGDGKYLKVHSPLQAFLIKGAEESSDTKGHVQSNDKSSKANHTAITEFVHTADELREAEYPIHPAAFTSQADAALEESRRGSAKQASIDGWVDSKVASSSPLVPASSLASPRDAISMGLTIYSIDCEMVLTSDEKSSLARVSLVSWPDGAVVVDKYVKPELEITNYFTQFSGITPKILEGVTTTLSDIQLELVQLFTSSTILLGHSLESDLNALKMTHPFIIDTSMIYPHPRGLPLRSSLKFLANKYLKREIQKGGANGHNSVEDAKAVLDLVKLKCEKGPKWGTSEANGETVFKRLSQQTGPNGKTRTSAMVEYGTPERGYGKDATMTVGCQDDDEITKGVIRAATGHTDDAGTPIDGMNFTWGRLRGLEFARGWVTNTPAPTSSSPDLTNGTVTAQTDLDTMLLKSIEHINKIHTALSASSSPTLLILCSGTSDVRPVMELQAIQNQYRKEFKVKKWDELSVKWTDTEEQALRQAVEAARKGWGWAGVV